MDPRAEQLIAGIIDRALQTYASRQYTMPGSEAVDVLLDLRLAVCELAELPWAEIGDLRVPEHRLHRRGSGQTRVVARSV